MYNTTCLKTALDLTNLNNENSWGIDEKVVTECAIDGQIGGQVEEGIPYVAGNTLWAVYQVI